MNTKWLRAFQAVITTKSMTQAAERLRLTQSAVSRMIGGLELELGFPVFLRHGGRLTPTAQGLAFYLEIEEILAGLDDVDRIARGIREEEGGQLRLFSMSSFVDDLVPQAMASFRREYPTARLSLDIRGGREFIYWDVGRRFELGLVLLPGDQQAANIRVFAQVPALAVLPAGHRLAEAGTLRLKDLATETLVMLQPTSLLRRWLDGKFAETREHPNIRIETSSMYSCCRYVSQGLGVTIADPFAIRAVGQDNLVVRPLEGGLLMSCGFVTPGNREPSPLVSRFMDIVSETAPQILEEIGVT